MGGIARIRGQDGDIDFPEQSGALKLCSVLSPWLKCIGIAMHAPEHAIKDR